jgi:chemotaxis methyl-accepting protein methylase|tara:strand:+ start:238 stop:417 length:180 start_codon:yes stop_codon:yes gene_type:complete
MTFEYLFFENKDRFLFFANLDATEPDKQVVTNFLNKLTYNETLFFKHKFIFTIRIFGSF